MKRAQHFVINVTCLSGMNVNVFFILPALIVNIRSCLLPRINEEPVSVGVVVIPTISSELATNFTLSLLQDISIVPIIVVVVVIIIG